MKPDLSEIAFVRTTDFPDRPTIVFLHDSLGCIRLWRDFPKRVGQLTQCNILVYDRQGYGDSCGFSKPRRDVEYLREEAEILFDLLQYWQTGPVVLFGHSDGGSIALIFAALYPDMVISVITEGAHVFVEDITLKGILEAEEAYQTTDLRSKLEKYHGEKTDAMFNAWTKTWTSSWFRDWNIEHYLPKITCPVLVIQGENDEFGSLAQVDAIVNGVSGPSQKVIVPDARHTPHKENAEVVLVAVSGAVDCS